MTIQLVGVGVGRTGTHSLKLALEHLLGGTCHHMMETNKEQVSVWTAAYSGDQPDWAEFLAPYQAIVDWPGASLWRELTAAFPDAPVLLSTRSSAEVWYKSASDTIFAQVAKVTDDSPQAPFLNAMMNAFGADWRDAEAAKAAYTAHNELIRATVSPERLFEYQPGDGWAPLCAALQLDEPDIDFPHTNSTAEFNKRVQARRSR